MNNDPIFLRILTLMKRQGKGNKDITKALGLAVGVFSQWQHDDKRKSYLSRIDEIAYFLGTTPTYLLRGDVVQEATTEEAELLWLFQRLTDEKKKCVMELLRLLGNDNNRDSNDNGGDSREGGRSEDESLP